MAKYDYIIVGAGLYGSTFAHLANKKGKKCLVIDKRPHLGGNLYCQKIEGINVHKYGPHIFHTSNKQVWDFVNSLVEFTPFINSPLAIYNGKLYNLPFNMNTFCQMWGVSTPGQTIEILNKQREEAKELLKSQGIVEPTNLEEQALVLIGKDIYQSLIKGYTEKQWGRSCKDLPPFIIKRLPVRLTFNNNYFNDKYQGIPVGGYNKLIEALLSGIDVELNCNFFNNREEYTNIADKILYTGKIDEFFNYCYGKLNYRSLEFKHEIIDTPNYQGNAVINYTNKEVPYTRIIEHKHFEFSANDIYSLPKSVITKEYPVEWKDGMEPYYPVNDLDNNLLYEKYKALAQNKENVIFGGRLAEYKYYDMAPIIEKLIKEEI